MILLSNKYQNSKIGFGQLVTVEKQSSTPPFLNFAFKYYNAQPSSPKITPEQIKALNAAEINYIKALNIQTSPLDPTDLTDTIAFNLKDQSLTLTESIADEMLDLGDKLDEHLTEKANIARDLLGEEIKEEIQKLNKSVMPFDESSPEFIKKIAETYEYMVNGTKAHINLESGRLDEIAKSKEAVIFIGNHDNAPYDASLLNNFLTELYKKYQESGNLQDVPRPKIVMDQRIYNGFPIELKDVLGKAGTTPVVATSYPTTRNANANKYSMWPIVEGFIKDKNHIFIYPEGRRNKFKNSLPVKDRFQYGIGKIIQDTLKYKNRVKVVCLGVAQEGDVGSIHIGNSLYFEKDGDRIKVRGGDITPETDSFKNSSFYRRLSKLSAEESMHICYGGIPVQTADRKASKFMSRLIAGILCTDVEECAKKAISVLRTV